MTRAQNILLLFFCFAFSALQAQIEFTNADVPVTNASAGDLYINTDTNAYFIGLPSGALKALGNVTAQGTVDNEVLAWNTATNSWAPAPASQAGLIIDKTTINTIDRARFALNAIGNVNLNLVPLTISSAEFNEIGATFTGSDITGLEGNVKFIIQPNFNTLSQRTNIICEFRVNGTPTRRVAGPYYGRDASNHDQTGGPLIFEYENASPSDTFSFLFQREANTGTVELVSSGITISYIFVEQFTSVEVVTNIEAQTNLSLVQGPPGPQGPTGPQGPAGPAISSPTDVYHATGSIADNGGINYSQGVATVTKLGTGRYQVTFTSPHDNGANYPVLFSMEQNPGRDDYIPSYTNVTPNGFEIQIGEQDNGGSAGVFVDAGFSFYIPL